MQALTGFISQTDITAPRLQSGSGRNGAWRIPGIPERKRFFLCILFPESELKILDYNRVVKDLGGQSKAEILERLRPNFNIMPYRRNVARPSAKGEIGMYLDHSWFLLTAKNNVKSGDAVKGLDVSILQDRVLAPVFGIENPRADARIDFVGGIRGAEELMERRFLCSRPPFRSFSVWRMLES